MEEKEALPFPYTNLGILSPPELAQAMCNSDVHLSFSLTNISYVPFEAVACGCVVVEAKVPSVEAMVKDGTHCLLAEPKADAVAETLLRLIADKGLRERIAKAGVDFVHDKTWGNSCKQFEDILFDSFLIGPKVPKEISQSPAVKELPEKQSANSSKISIRHVPGMAGIFYRSCNFCGGVKFRVFKKIDVPFPNRIYGNLELSYPDVGKHLKLQYLECTGCGLVGINPLTRFDDINRNTFDGERNIVARADIDYKEYAAVKLNTIKLIYDQYEFERYRQANRVLDVSCGPAVSLSWLRDVKGWEVFGIDPDRHSVRTAWERYGVRIENRLIYDLEVPDEHFDLIVMDNSLEHTFDPLSTLLKAFCLLRKGGSLFIFTPNCHGLSTRFLNANAHWGHWFLYSPKTVVDVLRRIGYEVPKLFAIQNPVNPALIEKDIDLAPYREGLEVSLIGKEVVEDQIGKVRVYSDFFNLIAVKPANARLIAEGEARLSGIAQSSLEQLEDVSIIQDPLVSLSQAEKQSNEYVKATVKARERSVPPDGDTSLQVLVSESRKFRKPWILNLGSRNVTGDLAVDWRSWFPTAAKFVGVDLEPGPGVDIVTDASVLSRVIRPHSFDIVVSVSVFEHLRRPWQVVLEINKILKTGGLVFIHSHQTFPLHDYPGDFFRFSEKGFKELFSENLGFEVLATGSQVPCRVVPSVEIPGWLKEHLAYINTTVCARKVADFDPSTYRWGES